MTREAENPERAGPDSSDARSPAPPHGRRARGDGSIFQKRYTDKKTGKTKKTSMLYMKFYIGGKPTVEPTGTTKHSEAKKILRRKLGEIASGRYIPADVDKTTFEQIKDMLLDHYRANERKSLDRIEDAVTHLESFFGLNRRVRDIAAYRGPPQRRRCKRDDQSGTRGSQADAAAWGAGRKGGQPPLHRDAGGEQQTERVLRGRSV